MLFHLERRGRSIASIGLPKACGISWCLWGAYGQHNTMTTSPNIELQRLADNSRGFMEFILEALGWRFASEGRKAEPPLPCFKVLGVLMDMSQASTGNIVVSNKPERIDDLVQTMGNILDKGYLSGSAAASLQRAIELRTGSVLNGCTLKPGMVFLQKVLRTGWHAEYRPELATVVCYIVAALRTSPPRQVCSTDETRAVLVFTDGAYEPDSEGVQCSSGLVIVDSSCEFRLVQEVSVPSVLIKHWSRGGAKQLIVFLELWPILVFLARYGRRFSNRRVIIFIDSNAVRDALIKGSSPLCDLFCMLALCSYYISSNSLCTWFTRVASDSNPGDDPSRGRAKEMAALIGALLASPLDAPEDLVKAIVSVESFHRFHAGNQFIQRLDSQPIENGGGEGASVQ